VKGSIVDRRLWFVGAFALVGVGLLISGLVLLRKPDPARAKAFPQAVLTDSGGAVGVKAGDLAPLFELRSDDGTLVRLADLRGKPVLINFFATWCPPCQEETPGIQETYSRLKERGLSVVSIDLQESSGLVSRFVSKYGVTFPVGIDASAAIARRYGVYGIPANFFLDPEGVIRFVDAALTPALIEQRLSTLW
jgi:peroxiredoxin